MSKVKLHPDWLSRIGGEFTQPYMGLLRQFLRERRATGKIIYPPSRFWFAALEATLPQDVRVVILGQDPYHRRGQAHGLCFSVQPGVTVPPSLANIYKELHDDLGILPVDHGYLLPWARQGVLLLNAVLTVESGAPASHKGQGWEKLTDAIISTVSSETSPPTVFLLWGSQAQRKAANILDRNRGGSHLILRAAHPSPLSAHNGFLGCRHFSQANEFLLAHGREPIDWQLPKDPVSVALAVS